MADIHRFPLLRHLRSEPSRHVLHYSRGRLARSGRGLAFWFLPLRAAIAEVPVDDRELPFLFHARSRDFQDVTVQGVVTWHVSDPEALAARVDFSIDLATGRWLEQPLEQLAEVVSGQAQQSAWAWIAAQDVRTILERGVDEVRERVRSGLAQSEALTLMGLEVAAVAVSGVAPTSELEKALQTPAMEAFQQSADQAMFQRRALAVEKERAIQENELQNQIELASRESELIERRGENDRRRAREEAEAKRIAAEAAADRERLQTAAEADGVRVGASARADSIEVVEKARVQAESERMGIYEGLEPQVLLGLAAREFAGKLQKIEHLTVTPDMLSKLVSDLLRAGGGLLGGDARPAKG